MIKKISFMISILLFLFSSNAFAHSHLEDSTPKNGGILTQSAKDFTLTFETNLEQTSTFTLADGDGTAIPLSNVTIEGNELVGRLGNDLANGAYSIHWNIIGTDGHPLEGDIPFTVQLPVSQTTATTAETTSTESAKLSKATNSTKETAVASQQNSSKHSASAIDTHQPEPTAKNFIVPLSVGGFLVVGAASYWLFFRRKHV